MQRVLLAFFSAFLLFSKPAFANDNVLVFAASSLTTALNDIASAYHEATGQQVTLSFASSSALARQLAYGAPADIFLSANEKWMDYAVSQGVIRQESVTPWIKNKLVLIASEQEQIPVALDTNKMLAVLGDSRLALADPTHVPAGIYGKESLENLGLWQALENKLALSNSARSTLALVERGESPLGIVYYSDAQASSHVKVAAMLPDNSHTPIVFPKALTNEASAASEAFFRFLDSPAAKAILMENGFVVNPE